MKHLLVPMMLTTLLACTASDDGPETETGTGTQETCEIGRYMEPGCGEGITPEFEAGCYEECATVGEACEGGGTCTTVTENPCICAEGEACCGACGSEVNVCL